MHNVGKLMQKGSISLFNSKHLSFCFHPSSEINCNRSIVIYH